MIDHETFRSSEIDALYGELDEEASAAMTAHAADCAECAARFERLKKTRGLVLAAAVEAVPDDFESRIMAAVDAGLAKRASVIPIGRATGAASGSGVAGAPAASTGAGGAKVIRLLSRPSFAVAATFVLVIGAGALILARSGTSLKSMAANDEAPSIAAAPAATDLTPVPMPAASGAIAQGEAQTIATATAAPTTMAVAPPAGVAPQTGGAVAMNDDAFGSPRPGAPAAKPSPRSIAAAKTASSADDRAFASAKSLYDAGRYADALPRFEALSGSNPEADLYAARCIAKTRGCAAAEARYDAAARTNAGTETGSRAQLEGARCYQSTGDVVAARKRYQAAKDEGVLANEAAKALDDLDHTGPGAGVAGGAHAAPRAAAPLEMAPAPSPASPPAKR